jgi:hypothetical protein
MKITYEPMGELAGDWEDLEPVTTGLPPVTVEISNEQVSPGIRDGVLYLTISAQSLTEENVRASIAGYFNVPINDVVFES